MEINWAELGFDYMKLPYRFIAHFKNGAWDSGQLTEDEFLHIHEGSTALHYGQQCFEGLKAYGRKDGKVNLFRPDQNSARLNRSARRLLMPEVPEELFLTAIKQVVLANREFVPPYGTGATLYLRPLLIGVGPNIGVHAAPEYIFTVFCMPVGAYFKGGLTPTNFIVSDYDRAAPKGTGAAKVGGIMRRVFYLGKKRKPVIFLIVSTLTQKHILKLKKSVPLTSLVSRKMSNL